MEMNVKDIKSTPFVRCNQGGMHIYSNGSLRNVSFNYYANCYHAFILMGAKDTFWIANDMCYYYYYHFFLHKLCIIYARLALSVKSDGTFFFRYFATFSICISFFLSFSRSIRPLPSHPLRCSTRFSNFPVT